MSTTKGSSTNSAPPAPEATSGAPAAPFTLVQLQEWWVEAGCKKEGKYFPTAANYANNWWLTITEDQVKADMANYKAKADAGEATAEGVPYQELAYGPELRPGTGESTGATISSGIEVKIKLNMDPELGLGMALALSKPVVIAGRMRKKLAGKKLQVVDKEAIQADPDLKGLVKGAADQLLCTGLALKNGQNDNSDDLVWNVEIDATKAKKEFKLGQLKFPGIVFVNRFARRKDGTKGQAESEGIVCLRDQLIKVNGERGNDLKSLVKLIKAGTGKEIELTFLRTQQNEEIRVKNLEDQKRAKTIETSLRVVFDKVRGDSSETFVTMSQLENAGLAIYRDAVSIVLPNIPPKEFFESLDENGDGKVTWEEFKNHLLIGSVGVSHAARMAHYAAIFEAITGGLSEEATMNIAVLKDHVNDSTGLMNRYFPSMANKIVSKFEELDADHSGDLDWGEFRDGCEAFWMENMHPEAAVKLEKLPKVELKEAKNMGKGLNAEDLVHKAVPSHLLSSSLNNEEAAKLAGELLEKQQHEQELKAQEEHRKALAAEAKKKVEDERKALEEKQKAAERKEDAENAPVAPAKGGCCVIA